MSTPFDENPDTKTLLADGGPESAAVDFDLTPDMPGHEAEGVAVQRSQTPEATHEVDGPGDKDGVAPESTTLDDAGEPAAAADETVDSPEDNPGTSLVTLPLCGETEAADDVIGSVGSSAPDDDDDSDDKSEPGDDTPGGNSRGGDAADETARPQLSKEALESLLDESTGELVALEDFECEVDDRAFENEWLGKHTPISLAVFGAELAKTGKCTFHVDQNGKLLDDPVRYGLAPKNQARITLCVHRDLSEDQKKDFILRLQARERSRTDPESRELKRKVIVAGLRLGVDYETIAKMAGVCPNTVRNVETRAAQDPNSKLGNTKRPDGRFKPETREKIAKAAKLRKEGKSNAEIAETFGTDVETVGKWLKDRPARDKAKGGKGKKKAPARPKEPTEDLAANVGPSELHQRALKHLKHLDQDAQDYDGLHKLAQGPVQEAVKDASSSVEDLLYLGIYGRNLVAAADAQLEELLRAGVEEDAVEEEPVAAPGPSAGEYEGGEVLDGDAPLVEPDGDPVSLPNGDGGVIAKGDTGVARLAVAEDGDEARIRANGFDSEPGLADRDPMSQDESVDVVEPDLDDLSPYERHFGRGEGSKE